MRKARVVADPSIDPRGLIFEASRIERIASRDSRTILLSNAAHTGTFCAFGGTPETSLDLLHRTSEPSNDSRH